MKVTRVLSAFVALALASSVATAQSLKFADHSPTAGISTSAGANGVAVADFDRNGTADLFIAADGGASALFSGHGDGTFTDVTSIAGVVTTGYGAAPLWADVNNDGHPDLFVGTRSVNHANRLFVSNGDGTFTDRLAEMGIDTDATVGSAAFGDFDNDGYVDLFMAVRGGPDLLYRNLAGTGFEDVTSRYGVQGLEGSVAMQASWFDYDSDGDLDLFAVHDGTVPNRLHVNYDAIYFQETAEAAGLKDVGSGNGMGLVWLDADMDGLTDLYITRIFEASLYRNEGGNKFLDDAEPFGLVENGMSWGVVSEDFDNDADPDLFIVNTFSYDNRSATFLYTNEQGVFSDVAAAADADLRIDAFGVASADFNNDGLRDLVIAATSGQNRLLLNTTENPGNWISIELTGTDANRMAIGATVRVTSGSRTQERTVFAGESYCAQNSAILHFGLGSATAVGAIEVRWPGEPGFESFDLTQLPVNTRFSIDQTAGLTGGEETGAAFPITFKYVPHPSDVFTRVFLPGEFNNWGPNTGGMIAPGAPSEMTHDPDLDMYLYTVEGWNGGDQAQYKIHFHRNGSGTDFLWLSDPANPVTNPNDNNNSVLTVADPMIFQATHRVSEANRVIGVSAGVFGTDEVAELQYWVNQDTADGIQHYDVATGIFAYDLPQPAPSNSLFGLLAVTTAGDSATAEIGTVPVAVEDAARPAGLIDGINYDPDNATTVTLSLFAPGKEFIHVIGDFNDWEARPEYVMKRDSIRADSVHFWITLDGLTPGVEYGFQYLIDGQLRVGDPYSQKILDPAYDAAIGDAYPNLKPYPAGQTTELVSVFQTNQPSYQWKVTDFERPPAVELIIYELLVRDFIEDHSYATLIDTLDYLERLGITAIELMPVFEFGRNDNWGYEPNFHLAVDKYYGPADDLKRFIDACHERGIAVLLDVVYNHHAYESPFSRMYSSSATGTPGAPPLDSSPWLNVVPKHPFNVFNDVNHESPATKSWLDRANEYWLTEFKVDGFRFDLSKGFTQFDSGNDVGLWGRYDASRVALLKRMADRLWEVDSTAIVILEHFADDREQRELAEYGMDRGHPGMLLWQHATHPYNEATMGYNAGSNSNFSGAYYGPGGSNWELPHLVTYMESHDEQWLMYKNRRFGACAASPFGGDRCNQPDAGYNTREVPIALDRMKMAAAFFLTLPGPHMVWQFGELGYGFGPDGRDCLRPSNTDFGDCPPGTPARTQAKPVRWEYRNDPLRWKLYQTWSELLRLRREYAVMRSTETDVRLSLSGDVKRITLIHPELSVAILGNFGLGDRTGAFLDAEPGMWYDFFAGGDSISIADPGQEFTLLPGQFYVLTNKPVDPAEDGLVTVSSESFEVPDAAGVFELASYPNPFSSTLRVAVTAPRHEHVRLELFDVLGRRVAIVTDETLGSGLHEFSISGDKLPAGTYYLRLLTREGQKTVPLTKGAS